MTGDGPTWSPLERVHVRGVDRTAAQVQQARGAPEGSAALREVTAWLAREHGPAAVLDLAEELAVDLAEALEAIAAVEQRDAVEVADRWFHDQPSPDVPGPGEDRDSG